MENSINFLHPIDTIKSSTDGKLYKKEDNEWIEISNILYKSEKKLPDDNLGENGDYYAKYYRKYNYFLYSEDFSQKVWNKNNCDVNKEPTLLFPYNQSTKLTASETLSEHSLEYLFYNKLRTTYTFSLYVHRNEIRNIALVLAEQDEKYGYTLKVNLLNNTFESSTFGDTEGISNTNANIEALDNNVVRIWITAKFNTALILKAAIKLLDNDNNEVFKPDNKTYGLFINGAQLVESTEPEEYILSNGKYATALILKNLYTKNEDKWEITNNKVFFLNKLPTKSVGTNGDISCIDALIELSPVVMFGDSKNINRWKRPVGTMFYNKHKDKWYVKTKRGDYSLEFVKPKPDYHAAAIAISLNQQIYQTYDKYGRVSHFKGFNTGGNYNFWIRNTGKTRY